MDSNYKILKLLTKIIFICGGGNFWYEDNKWDNKYYRIWSNCLFLYCIVFIVTEILASFYGDFPEDQMNEAFSFGMSHMLVYIKLISLLYHKGTIKELNLMTVKVCESHEDKNIINEQYKKIKTSSTYYCAPLFITMMMFVIKGIVKLFTEDMPFLTVITLFPKYEDRSLLAMICRVLITVLWYNFMAIMTSMDTFMITQIIILEYKFKTLMLHFEKLRTNFDSNPQSHVRVDNLKRGLVEGIKMHENTIRLFKKVQDSFGVALSIQVFVSSGSSVFVLIQIAVAPNLTLIAMTSSILFVACCAVFLAQFMLNAGDVTHQASLLPDAIFQCGWHECAYEVRHLVIMACVRAQKPLIMKAFSYSDLSYSSYLSIVRGTYSIFALFYNMKRI